MNRFNKLNIGGVLKIIIKAIKSKGFKNCCLVFFGKLADQIFDFIYHTSTCDGFVGDYRYQGTSFFAFRGVIREVLPSRSEKTFIDLGSGKGKILLQAASMGFKKVIGVEMNVSLSETAVGNILKYKDGLYRNRIQTYNSDVVLFDFPDEIDAIYLFNPFGYSVMKEVINHIVEKFDGSGVFIIYNNPIFELSSFNTKIKLQRHFSRCGFEFKIYVL